MEGCGEEGGGREEEGVGIGEEEEEKRELEEEGAEEHYIIGYRSLYCVVMFVCVRCCGSGNNEDGTARYVRM